MSSFEIGSEEWKKVRRALVTATDSAAILGVSPWCTRTKLLRKKVLGIETPVTAAMQRGIDLEEAARHLFEKEMGEMVFPDFKTCAKNPWLAATFDGYNDLGTLIEIKCPGEEDHNYAMNGAVPKKYYPQLQTQMVVANVHHMWYISYRPESDVPYIRIAVGRDDRYCLAMLVKLKQFYDELMALTPEDFKVAHLEPTEEIMNAELELIKFIAISKQAETNIETLKQYLTEKCNFKECEGTLLRYKPLSCKGKVDYSAIPELEGVDLETYRKPPSIRWSIEEL